jgi:peptidoglycan/xylan/chitin deacetylase (PgdA/CDA1 family)
VRAILTYHSIDESGSPISISRAEFARHADFLASGKVKVESLAELARSRATEDDAVHAVALTFDDGFANFATDAWPLLRERGLPATMFVVTDRAGTTNEWDVASTPGIPVLPLLDWTALRALAAQGLSIGAHGRRHVGLRGLEAERLRDEVAGSKARIESETGRAPDAFAYPFGAHDDAAVLAARTSYAWACTTELRALAPGDDPHRLPRLEAWYLRASGRLESFGTPGFRSFLRWRRVVRHAGEVLRSMGERQARTMDPKKR